MTTTTTTTELRVLFGIPVGNRVHPQTKHALDVLREELLAEGIGFLMREEHRGSLPLAHSLLALEALQQNASHLFILHADVSGFTARDVLRILRSGEDLVGAPLPGRSFDPGRVAAALVAGVPPERAWLHAAPQLWWPKSDGPAAIKNGHLFECEAMSTGFMCISRRALLAAASVSLPTLWGDIDFPHVFEECRDVRRQLMSEDRAFCLRCKQAAGIRAWMDLDTSLIHWGDAAFHAAPLREVLAPVPDGPRRIALAARFDLACPVSCEGEARAVVAGPYDLPLDFDRRPHVLDLGANVGAFARWAMVRWPGATVDCVEPQEGEVLEALRFNRVPGMEIIDRAVWTGKTGETIDFFARPHAPTGSHVGDAPACEGEERRSVLTIDARDLADADVIKLDVEGNEPAILDRYLSTTRRTRGVIAEWHQAKDRDELLAVFERHGFRLVEARPGPHGDEIGVARAVRG